MGFKGSLQDLYLIQSNTSMWSSRTPKTNILLSFIWKSPKHESNKGREKPFRVCLHSTLRNMRRCHWTEGEILWCPELNSLTPNVGNNKWSFCTRQSRTRRVFCSHCIVSNVFCFIKTTGNNAETKNNTIKKQKSEMILGESLLRNVLLSNPAVLSVYKCTKCCV